MTKLVAKIEEKIRALKPQQKIQLLRSLIAKLDGPADSDAERSWVEAARRRQREIIKREVKAIPAEQVFKKGRSRLKR